MSTATPIPVLIPSTSCRRVAKTCWIHRGAVGKIAFFAVHTLGGARMAFGGRALADELSWHRSLALSSWREFASPCKRYLPNGSRMLGRICASGEAVSTGTAKQRTAEHMVDVPVPQMLKEYVEAVKMVPRECGRIQVFVLFGTVHFCVRDNMATSYRAFAWKHPWRRSASECAWHLYANSVEQCRASFWCFSYRQPRQDSNKCDHRTKKHTSSPT